MGLFGIGKKFNNNAYGIDKKTEWKGENGLKEELKKTGLFTKKDLKEIKKAIKSDQLSSYMDTMGIEMQNALGLSLSSKVDLTTKQLEELREMGHFTTAEATPEDITAAISYLEKYVSDEGTNKELAKAFTMARQETRVRIIAKATL